MQRAVANALGAESFPPGDRDLPGGSVDPSLFAEQALS